MKRYIFCGILAVFLSLLFALPALAGAPGEGERPAARGVGGLTPEAPPEGWTEYPTAPSAQYGGAVMTAPPGTWPRYGPDGWINIDLNPGKWLVDGATGAFTGLLQTMAGTLQQVVFWLSGREVENPYAGGSGQGAQGAGIAGSFNVFSYTPPSLTYLNTDVVIMYNTMSGTTAFFLGLAVLITGGRGLLSMVAGRTPFHGLGETIRRFIVAVALSSILAWFLAESLINLNNLLIDIFIPWELASDALQSIMYNQISDALVGTGLVLETALMLVVLLFALAVLAVIMLARLVLLDILLILSPLAGMSYATPETEFLFTRWFNALVSVTFYQFLTMLFLALGFRFINTAWSHTAENPILLAALAVMAVIMAIFGPPVVGFAINRAASSAVTRTAKQVVAAME